jgi:beta-glucosidase
MQENRSQLRSRKLRLRLGLDAVYPSSKPMSEAKPVTPPRIPRVEALLEQMTLLEKAGQMSQCSWGFGSDDDARAAVAAGKLGSVLNAPSLEERNRLQHLALETRLAVPLIFGRDVIHGYKTIFPISLGLAASFDESLAERTARAAAREAVEVGIDWTFAPMVDVTREPRWGRVAESFGEDPELTSRMGAAMVRGFQGSAADGRERVAACAKHFAAYGATESGKEYNTTWVPEPLLRDVYLPPFRACVKAGVMTMMTGFNDLNGVPASGNAFLLRKILKGEWSWPGMVVSDWASMLEMIQHGLCESEADVARVAANAGVDLEMASRTFVQQLPGLVEAGLVPLELVNDAVRRVLSVKHELGLFEEPFRKAPVTSVAVCAEHLELAREAARSSAVLLKNDGALLPLASSVRRLAVIGPLADAAIEQLGSWSYDGAVDAAITPLAALHARLGDAVQIEHVPGLPDCRSTDDSGFAAAIDAAAGADVTLLFLGEPANISGECRSRAFLDLPGAQSELLARVAATGKPIVLIIMAGRPLAIGDACAKAGAVLYAWHLGTMAGPGLVDLLMGDVVPSGKLPISFPRTVGQVPVYYAHKSTGRPPKNRKGIPTGTPLDPTDFDASYLDVEVTPEFPFGFGLSYAKFEHGDVEVTPARATLRDTIVVRAQLRNSGSVAGMEIVQLYVRDVVGSLTRPVRELKGFARVALAAGEQKTVEFRLTADDLSFCTADGSEKAEPGKFQIFVGGDSRAPLGAELELV